MRVANDSGLSDHAAKHCICIDTKFEVSISNSLAVRDKTNFRNSDNHGTNIFVI